MRGSRLDACTVRAAVGGIGGLLELHSIGKTAAISDQATYCKNIHLSHNLPVTSELVYRLASLAFSRSVNDMRVPEQSRVRL